MLTCGIVILIVGRAEATAGTVLLTSAAAEAWARAAELSPKPKNRMTANADELPARKNLFKSVSNSAAGRPSSHRPHYEAWRW